MKNKNNLHWEGQGIFLSFERKLRGKALPYHNFELRRVFRDDKGLHLEGLPEGAPQRETMTLSQIPGYIKAGEQSFASLQLLPRLESGRLSQDTASKQTGPKVGLFQRLNQAKIITRETSATVSQPRAQAHPEASELSKQGQQLIELLAQHPGLKAKEIAERLAAPRKVVNQLLYGELQAYTHQDADFGWRKLDGSLPIKSATQPCASQQALHQALTTSKKKRIDMTQQLKRHPQPQAQSQTSEPSSKRSSKGFAFESLQALRQRLLDLSGRNKLISYRYTKTNAIRVVDELPDQLFDQLLNDKSMVFGAVPEPRHEQLIEAGFIRVDEETGKETQLKNPTAKEWANWLGLNTDYELPKAESRLHSKHQDSEIQTLMFPPEMESRLRGLRSKANTAIEETGANVLFLAFGFLEWQESNDSKLVRHAPLLMLPVTLEKGKLDPKLGTYRYSLSYSGEDLLPNLSLREKLRQDFGLALPDFDEAPLPEQYLADVQSVIERHQPKWRTHRHCTLTLLDFSKQLMYFDLDPERWPQGAPNITEHPLVKRFFESRSDDEIGDFSQEYRIDQLKGVHEHYPLIDDADSSQHSALIDAIKGKNLVVEGPPGTGKSQTITNLIAAAIAQGKKVLFVAEKMAALEVVKRRLDKAGLGDFCLELHSHKTQKRKLLDDLAARLAMEGKFRAPHTIDTEIELYEANRAKLSQYAEKLNTQWQQTGKTVQQILASAVRYREQNSTVQIELSPETFHGKNLSAAKLRGLQDQAEMFADIYQQMAAQCEAQKLEAHPWYGVKNLQLAQFEFEKLITPLGQWLAQLARLADTLDKDDLSQLGLSVQLPWQQLEQQVTRLTKLPKLAGDEDLSLVAQLSEPGELGRLAQLLQDYQQLHDTNDALATLFEPQLLDCTPLQSQLSHELDSLMQISGAPDASPEQLVIRLTTVENTIEQLKQVEKLLSDIRPNMTEGAKASLKTSRLGLKETTLLFEFAQSLDPALVRNRQARFDNPAMDPLLTELEHDLSQWQAQQVELQTTFRVERLPQAEELHRLHDTLRGSSLFSWFSSAWRQDRKTALGLAQSSTKLEALVEALPQAAQFKQSESDLIQSPEYQNDLGELFRGTDTDITKLKQLRSWYCALREEYGFGFGARAALADSLMALPAQMLLGMQNLASQPEYAALTNSLQALDQLQQHFSHTPALSNSRQDLLDENHGLLALKTALRNGLNALQPQLRQQDAPLRRVRERLNQLLGHEKAQQHWSQQKGSFVWGNALALDVHAGKFSETELARVRRHQALTESIGDLPQLMEMLRGEHGHLAYNQLTKHAELASQSLLQCNEGRKQFSSEAKLDIEQWTQFGGNSVAQLIGRNQRALAQTDFLNTWIDYLNIQHKMTQLGLGKLTLAVEQHRIEAGSLDTALAASIYALLSKEIINEAPEIMRYSGKEQSAIQNKFREYDNKLKKLNQQKIAYQASKHDAPAGNSGGKVSTYSEMALIRHELGKKTRHLPIRQLINRAGASLVEVKPCFMMGPMSVAQYLEPGQIEFDLVVMDEASQVKPEDAIGTIARGKQVVVVGDPKQLPPTSFFDRAIDTEEEDVSAIEESESILDAAIPMFGCRRLRWHYRSRHESLIAFSNKSFYDSDLVVFPSPFARSDDYGVKFTRIEHGRFVNRRNIEEARVIARAVAHHLKTRPGESLGVVAMSADQREQIERSIEEISKDDPLLQNALAKESDEPLFVKNLENVQGDERDVIFISFTYGPQEVGGKVPQRFGPINSAAGWRRLNVLFTRSKKRMHVFSSMTGADILTSETSSRGVIALKEFLAFAQTGVMAQATHTGKEPDSDFEIAVMERLRQYGYECEPQVGVAGFFIDLAVKDPGKPGRYLMGIECDGATYHSAKSARDRDRLRQQVLEGLDWNIQRIWSTDWFKNPEGELVPILRQLDELRTPAAELQEETQLASEIEEIEAIQSDSAAQDEVTDQFRHEVGTLQEKLRHFNASVIVPEFPDTPDDKRLLRPAMVEALDEFQPCTKSEFNERIPAYLRLGTASPEGRAFLEAVLDIIEQFEVEVTG
ncbi:DUF4011 domain-containing anti-phage protein Hhe [Ferrimonas pelagia]|uniref:DUF4011 domain-containing protein n=1 Tax=Ferrimonas pelagia TaxID=1177826 RepID=A0ABP9EW64_9GAMM